MVRGEDVEEGGELSEAAEAAPEGGGSRIPIGGASGKAAELSDPADSLAEGWWFSRGRGCPEHAASEGLPLMGGEEVGAGSIWLSAGQASGEEEAPGDHAGEGKAAMQALSSLQLAFLDLAAA